MVMLIPLFSLPIASCGSDDNDEPGSNTNNGAYSFFDTQHFSKKWMVASIEAPGDYSYSFEYDANNRPVAATKRYHNNTQKIEYAYDGNTCTLTIDWSTYKGHFDGNKLIKAEWDEYIITNVKYEGNRLVKGSNGYRVTWDSNGNITNYTDGGTNFTYTEILNKANIDFNMILVHILADCWCDDGSEYFAIFGWTGMRTTNLISTRLDQDGDHYEYSYLLDELGRPVEIQIIENDETPIKYIISYVEN